MLSLGVVDSNLLQIRIECRVTTWIREGGKHVVIIQSTLYMLKGRLVGTGSFLLKGFKKERKKKVFWKNKSQALSAYSGTTAFVNIILRMSQSVCTSSSTVL